MRYLLILFSLLVVTSAFAQSHGISYQAILMEETDQELPGIDVPGGILPNKSIAIRFTITRQSGGTVYQEVHQHTTDDYGLINVVIGNGNVTAQSPTNFIDIDWDGTPMDLKVEIDLLEGASFENFSEQELFFVPYAFHRNITATGTLDVNQATTLGDDLNVSGITTLDSDLTVANGSPTTLTGDLTVEGETTLTDLELSGDLLVRGVTNLEGVFSVNNNSPSFLSGELMVDGITTLGNALNVENASPTYLTGSLTTDGESILNGILTVNEVATFNEAVIFNSDIIISSDNPGHVAIFENINSSTGDGIIIRLGKQATKNHATATLKDDALKLFVNNGVPATSLANVRAFLDSDATNDPDLFTLLDFESVLNPTELADIALSTLATACQLATSASNKLIEFLNSELGLPVSVNLALPERDLLFGTIPAITIYEGEIIPAIPTVPKEFCSALGPGFELGRFQLSDIYVSNPLSSENQFITFEDNTEWKMGAIQAQSLEEWATGYLNAVYFSELFAAFSGLDRTKVFAEMKVQAQSIASAYLDVGVEYSSGNGDYAEWLERLDPNEPLNSGDIVGVIGGKITKDLTNAEQVMAISMRPIVLGNVPQTDRKYLGNNVAFMGQIPVKVMGPVKTGDYVIGNPNIPGYGLAVSPKDLLPEQLKLAVGRAWQSNETPGPKMVNTVIGVHNGDYVHILKSYEDRVNLMESRLDNLESKITDLLIQQSSMNNN